MKSAHAIVIGGSIAGLAAARVLSEHFKQVTLIERDELDGRAMHRPGAPQSQHQHALLARTRAGFDLLFPGFSERLLAGGSQLINPGLDFAFYGPKGWMTRQPGVEALFQSRSHSESVLRSMAYETVRDLKVMTSHEVVGLQLTSTAGRSRVAGVKLREKASGHEAVLEADLIVDASGRSSQTLNWFKSLGLGVPDETTVDAFCGYSSRWYQAPQSLPAGWWWKAAYSASRQDNPMGGSIAPLEGGRWLVTTWGYAKHYPPTDDEGFELSLRHGLATPLIHEMARLAEPISPVYSFRGFVNRRRWFSRWAQLPERYISVGDVSCVFNPVHGQGMGSAVMAAECLAATLQKHRIDDPEFGRIYFRTAEKMQDVPAELSCGYDLRFKEAVGERPPFFAAKNWFFDHYTDAMQHDHDLYLRLMRVMHLLDEPSSLSKPGVIARVLVHIAKKALTGKDQPNTSPFPPMDFRQPPLRIEGGRKIAPRHQGPALHQPVSALPGWRLARIVSKREEAKGIYSFELVSDDGEPLPSFEAGAHIDLKMGEYVRQYSLCNRPQDSGRYVIGVQREPDSRGGSSALCEGFGVGDRLLWRGPRQSFALAAHGTGALLLAGGIGITPLLAMAEALSAQAKPFELHVCTRSLARTPFIERLKNGPWAGSVHLHLDDGDERQQLDLRRLLSNRDPGWHVYVCGPGGFIDSVTSTATTLGWPADRLHQERFSAAASAGDDRPFSIELRRSNRTLQVPADRSALSVLRDAGCDVPASCETGVCGTCVTAVLEGEPDHRDSFLSPEERRTAKVFVPCSSRALSDRLVLDL